MACGFCSISANASVSPASSEKIWHKVKSSSFTGIFPGERTNGSFDFFISRGRCRLISLYTVSDIRIY
jgi:hypothetical protein